MDFGDGARQILPEVILGVMLVVLLVVTANRTLKKGIKSYKKETLELEVGPFSGKLLDWLERGGTPLVS